MLLNTLLVAHIATLGYWLGSELVINSTYRYVSWAGTMPFAERNRLMDHVMDVDQHVRYALIIQAGLGTMLAALLGYFPGGNKLAVGAAIAAVAWFALAEVTHRTRKSRTGMTLAAVDRWIRYIAIAGLLLFTAATVAGVTQIPGWLAVKLFLFGSVIACGIGIRLQLIRFYVTWRRIENDGSNESFEREIRRTYVAATSILGILWLCIGGIVAVSIWKP